MTAVQMKYEFEIGYELANLFSRSYNEKEISTFLTNAQNQLVLDVLDGEYMEMKNILINNLKVYSEIISTFPTAEKPYSTLAALPIDFLKPLHERVDITLNSFSSFYNINSSHVITDVPILSITEDYYSANINNPNKTPYEKLVWRLLFPSKVILIGNSSFLPSNYKVSYIKRPTPIIIPYSGYVEGDGTIDGISWTSYTTNSLNCVLEEVFHRQIVDRAITFAIKSSGDTQRLQTQLT